MVARCTRMQNGVCSALAFAAMTLGGLIGIAYVVIPEQPGAAVAEFIVLLLGFALFGAGVAIKQMFGAKVSRIRRLLLETPETITEAKVVQFQVEHYTTYAVHFKNRDGETFGLKVPTESMAHEIIARIQGRLPQA